MAPVDVELHDRLGDAVPAVPSAYMSILQVKATSNVIGSTARAPIQNISEDVVQDDVLYFKGNVDDLRIFFDDFSSVMRPTNTKHQGILWIIEQEGTLLQKVRVQVLNMK